MDRQYDNSGRDQIIIEKLYGNPTIGGGNRKPQVLTQAIPYRRSPHFVGREEELGRLHELLSRGDRVAVTAISGMGGVGKTELAVQYAWEYFAEYGGGVCWLKGRLGGLEAQILQKAELELGLDVPQEWRGKQQSLAEQVQWCWNHWQPGKTVLLVLDDVGLETSYQELLPPEARFRVLLTTRERKLDAGFAELPLGVLERGAALELLAGMLGENDGRMGQSPQAADGLCEWLGDLPLGLELVGRYLAKHGWLSLGEMQARLSLEDEALERDSRYVTTAERGVKAAFELTWQTLEPETQRVARLLSLFAPDGIPWELVEAMMGRVEESEANLGAVRSQLENSYLIQPGETGAIYKIHALIRQFLQGKRQEATEEEATLRQAFAAEMIAIAQSAFELPPLEKVTALIPVHLHLEVVTQNLLDCVSDCDLLWAFMGSAEFYGVQGLYQLAEPSYAACLRATQERFGQEHPDVATSLNNLADLYHSQGRYEAAELLLMQALEMRQQLLGDEHPDVATSLNGLAGLRRSQGRYEDAELLYVKALELRQRLLGYEHPDIAASLNNLAGLYESQGRYEVAEPLLLQALEMAQRLLGQEHPDVATSLNNLAGLYESQGRYKDAESLLMQALELRQRLLGHEHPDVATNLNNLALIYHSQGRYEAAEPLLVQALEMMQRLLGQEHPDVAASLNNLALLYRSQGRYEDAELLYVKALELRQRLLGQEHPDVATSLNNLAGLYRSQGRYKAAELLLVQALEMRQRLLGQEHPDVATSLNNLAGLYESQGRYKAAELLYAQALELRQQLLGQEHPDVAASLNNLAVLCYYQGRFQEAENLLLGALKILEQELGVTHPNTISAQQSLKILRAARSRPLQP